MEDREESMCVFDLECGIFERTWLNPWQTDTCIGRWRYWAEARCKSVKTVIELTS